ncbi:probable LRR receptor-like serine/threonine-protein kinase At1g53440 [Neltuma alba]|uniref:probable LRR receptor-like serine/threonine-protein kinase At1g53440 n=1 Tax=Neltuma alba TaxID=207710 RepID=UPI0010A3A925|nr:probable LRR receptor-like serine/threonine-protein kinase At1g53440 [Prosopis alba]
MEYNTTLRKIAGKPGKKDWDFNVDPCTATGTRNWTKNDEDNAVVCMLVLVLMVFVMLSAHFGFRKSADGNDPTGARKHFHSSEFGKSSENHLKGQRCGSKHSELDEQNDREKHSASEMLDVEMGGIENNFKVPSQGLSVDNQRNEKGFSAGAVVGIMVGLCVFLILVLLIILRKNGILYGKDSQDIDLKGLDLKTGIFTLKEIKAAMNNFNADNKIGEGGFGPVYKGILKDGRIIAVKQLSTKSRQGNREFLNEIGMIFALQHPCLVKLHGCCIEGDHLLLIYEFMDNNSLARALLGPEELQIKLEWPTRHKICIGIARGLAYLHEESRFKIVHRDIKATNVLLDKDLNPKISDFGLAKLYEEENTHISTRIAGTCGYMAPEYAMHGYLTKKADVYSFGIVALEIISGKINTTQKSEEECFYLRDWAHQLKDGGNLMDMVDPKLGEDFNREEIMTMIDVALQCTENNPKLRPTMSKVLSILEGRPADLEVVSDVESEIMDDDLKLKSAMKEEADKDETNQAINSSSHECQTTSQPLLEFYQASKDSSS